MQGGLVLDTVRGQCTTIFELFAVSYLDRGQITITAHNSNCETFCKLPKDETRSWIEALL